MCSTEVVLETSGFFQFPFKSYTATTSLRTVGCPAVILHILKNLPFHLSLGAVTNNDLDLHRNPVLS